MYLRTLFMHIVVAVSLTAGGALHADEPGADSPWRLSLNGEWRFVLVSPEQPGPAGSFFVPEFSCSDWPSIAVPSNWEFQGFEKSVYESPSDSIGLYRCTFRIPPAWLDRHVILRFDAVLFGFECWVNGHKAGSNASGFTPVEFDITPYIARDRENVLAVRVSKRSHGYEFDCHDDWAWSGIFRDVTLKARPNVHVDDLTVTTVAGDPAEVRVRAEIAAYAGTVPGSGLFWTGRLCDAEGRCVGEFDAPVAGVGENARTISVSSPHLWNAESPYLYHLHVVFRDANGPLEEVSRAVGIRTVSVVDGVLELNGTPIKLHGVDRHSTHPATGRVLSEEQQQQDIALMKAANINAIRTSHNPPEQRFIDLCDEKGFYVICEVPFGGNGIHLDDPSYQPDLLARADATVLRDRSHPSVIIWSIGNENPYTPLVGETVKRVKTLDPTRPVCLPEMNNYAVKVAETLPDFVDIFAPHYPMENQLHDWARELKRPVMATEFCHALGNAFEGLRPLWEVMWNNERLAGGCIWHWCDQGVYRDADPGEFDADLAGPLEGKVYLTRDRLIDSYGKMGTDGIVYADRRPQVDYWQTQAVFSPVQFADCVVAVKPGAQSIPVSVTNRYDFTDLSADHFQWRLFDNQSLLAEGSVEIALGPRQSRTVEIPANVPQDLERNACRIEIACTDASGVSIGAHVIRLVPASLPHDFKSLLEREQKTRKRDAVGKLPALGLRMNRGSGQFAIAGAHDANSPYLEGPWARAGRKTVMAERHVRKRHHENQDFNWEPYLLAPRAQVCRVSPPGLFGGDWRIKARFPRVDKPEQALSGLIRLLEDRHGWLDVQYDLAPDQATGVFLEAGLSMRLAPSLTEFRWLGDGPYYSYPGVDEAAQHGIHHLSVDSLHFEGNRANVELLAVTDLQGNGIGFVCESSNLAWERCTDGVFLSHNAIVSGRGNKGVDTRYAHPAADTPSIQGGFRLIRLEAGRWPALFLRVFGGDAITDKAEPSPYLRTYDY